VHAEDVDANAANIDGDARGCGACERRNRGVDDRQPATEKASGPSPLTGTGSVRVLGAAVKRQKRPGKYRISGFHAMKAGLKRRGLRAIDGRTSLARAVSAWRAEVEQDRGGASELSRSEHSTLDAATGDVALLTIIDAWMDGSTVVRREGRRRPPGAPKA